MGTSGGEHGGWEEGGIAITEDCLEPDVELVQVVLMCDMSKLFIVRWEEGCSSATNTVFSQGFI